MILEWSNFFGLNQKIIVYYIILLFDSCPKTFGSDQIFLSKSKTFLGAAEGQGIIVVRVKAVAK